MVYLDRAPVCKAAGMFVPRVQQLVRSLLIDRVDALKHTLSVLNHWLELLIHGVSDDQRAT